MLAVYRNGTAGSATVGPASVSGAAPSVFLWCATGRDNTTSNAAAQGSVYLDDTRSATTCYMRGLKENIEIQTSSGLPWQWRRITFTFKGLAPYIGFTGVIENSNGFARYLYNIGSSSNTDVNILAALTDVLFKGTAQADWNNFLTAPVDNTRVTIKSDTTCIISSGNTSGKLKLYKKWHTMNSNLVYDDDESGGGKIQNLFSVKSKQGMGDYWIVDYFQPGLGGTSSDQLSFAPTSTLYWHEK